MNEITIEITSSPRGKKLSGIYLNDELVATEVPYIGTFAVGTLEEYSYFLNFTDEEQGKLLSVKSETSDINKIKLGESILNIVSLPYSTNTMANQIKLDVTDTLIQGYRFDEYNNGETLSTSQSYTHTLDPSAESETITVKTTPLWVWPMNFRLAPELAENAFDFIVNSDNREHTPVTITTNGTNLKKKAKTVELDHNYLTRSASNCVIEIGTTGVADLTASKNNYFSVYIGTNVFKNGLWGNKDQTNSNNFFYIERKIVNSPMISISTGTLKDNEENYVVERGGTTKYLVLPISTISIEPALETQQSAEVSGKLALTNIEFPKSIYLALSTSNAYSDVKISSNGGNETAAFFFDMKPATDDQELIAVYTEPTGDLNQTINLMVSSEVTGREDVTFKLTSAWIAYINASGSIVDISSWDSGTPAITIDSVNNYITVSTDVFKEMFGGNNMGEHNFALSTWVTYYLTIDGEYVYKNANLTVNAESPDINKIKINDVEEALPFSTNIALGEE